VAVTVFPSAIGSAQVGLVPVQAPLQVVKVEPEVGVAVRVTFVPIVSVVLQAPPQEMPPTSEVTVPCPLPALLTLRVWVCRVNVTVTAFAWSIVTVQVELVPLQAPLQPVKVESEYGNDVRVTTIPLGSVAAQLDPHLMPPMLENTSPPPVPALLTASVKVPVLNMAVIVLLWSIVGLQSGHVPLQEGVPL
jgi:hypothetical protein